MNIKDDLNALYYGAGMDMGLTGEEFVALVKAEADRWLEENREEFEAMEAMEANWALEDAEERALEERADREGTQY